MNNQPASPMTQIVIGSLGLVFLAGAYWGYLVAKEQGMPPEIREEMPGRVRGVVVYVYDAPARFVYGGGETTIKQSVVEYVVDGQKYTIGAGGDRGVGAYVFVAYKPSDPSYARAYHNDAGEKKFVAVLCLATAVLCIAVIVTGIRRIARRVT